VSIRVNKGGSWIVSVIRGVMLWRGTRDGIPLCSVNDSIRSRTLSYGWI